MQRKDISNRKINKINEQHKDRKQGSTLGTSTIVDHDSEFYMSMFKDFFG